MMCRIPWSYASFNSALDSSQSRAPSSTPGNTWACISIHPLFNMISFLQHLAHAFMDPSDHIDPASETHLLFSISQYALNTCVPPGIYSDGKKMFGRAYVVGIEFNRLKFLIRFHVW